MDCVDSEEAKEVTGFRNHFQCFQGTEGDPAREKADTEEVHDTFVANNSSYSRFNDHAHSKTARDRRELK